MRNAIWILILLSSTLVHATKTERPRRVPEGYRFQPYNDRVKGEEPIIGYVLSLVSVLRPQPKFFGDNHPPDYRAIVEGDRFFTVAGQRLTILMEDGTKLTLGPSSQIIFKNWYGREKNNHRVRSVELTYGLLWAKVRKIYSPDEPFLVENKQGVVSVQGTEFVVEASEGGHLVAAREQKKKDVKPARGEVEVHTLEGEVHLAKNRAALKDWNHRARIPAGQTALVREDMDKPQMPHEFSILRFQSYYGEAIPEMKLAIQRDLTNEKRAEIAINNAPFQAPSETPSDESKPERAIASEQAGDPGKSKVYYKKRVPKHLQRRQNWVEEE